MSIFGKKMKALPVVLALVLLSLSAVLFLGRVPVGVRYGAPSSGLPGAATNGMDIVSAARRQVGVTVAYDPSYLKIPYPNGDVPKERGVCSDVVVRALREARGMDLQKLVHEDMGAHFIFYPSMTRWLMFRPDANIDHRRVLNLERVFVSRDALLGFPYLILSISASGRGVCFANFLQPGCEAKDFSTLPLTKSWIMHPVMRVPVVSDLVDMPRPPLRPPLVLVLVVVRTSFSVGDVTSVLNTPFSSSTTGIVLSPRNSARPSVVPTKRHLSLMAPAGGSDLPRTDTETGHDMLRLVVFVLTEDLERRPPLLLPAPLDTDCSAEEFPTFMVYEHSGTAWANAVAAPRTAAKRT